MPKLILIRHGQSINNTGETVQGSDPDPANVLSDRGRQQAYMLGHVLVGGGIAFAGVWTSPLVRARQTCDLALSVVGSDLPVRGDPRLREMCKGLRGLPGGMEGRRRNEVKTPEYRAQYKQGGWDFRHGSLESGGETARETGTRFLAAMNDAADSLADDETGLVFAHGQAIRFGLGAALGFPDIQKLDAECRLDNCEGFLTACNAENQWQFLGRLAAD